MKKVRFLFLMMALFIIILAFTGCKEKEFAEVHTKFSDNEISFLSQDSQTITVDIEIIDNEQKMNFEKKISISSDEVTSLQINDMADKTFFTADAKITNVTIQKQEENEGDVIAEAWLISLGVACAITSTIAIILVVKNK